VDNTAVKHHSVLQQIQAAFDTMREKPATNLVDTEPEAELTAAAVDKLLKKIPTYQGRSPLMTATRADVTSFHKCYHVKIPAKSASQLIDAAIRALKK
jgi:hypothetical protein